MRGGLVKERPILFNGPMVQAILAGHKTQTRRPIKGVPDVGRLSVGDCVNIAHSRHGEVVLGPAHLCAYTEDGEWSKPCPFGAPGDLLWVRETWRQFASRPKARDPFPDNAVVDYRADFKPEDLRGGVDEYGDKFDAPKWRPSILMPRWASRLILRVVSVRAERVQQISGADVLAEGVGEPWNSRGIEAAGGMTPEHEAGLRDRFMGAWCEAYGERGTAWDPNPWVWAVEFERVTP
jgi:hypothetical protein